MLHAAVMSAERASVIRCLDQEQRLALRTLEHACSKIYENRQFDHDWEVQVADNMPLYGVCCYMDELVHRPPAILRSLFPEHNAPLNRYLVAAPRCYCLLTHYPFFSLHLKVFPKAWEPCLSHLLELQERFIQAMLWAA